MFWLQKLQHLQVSSSSSKVGVPKFWNFSILSVSPLALAPRVHRVLNCQIILITVLQVQYSIFCTYIAHYI